MTLRFRDENDNYKIITVGYAEVDDAQSCEVKDGKWIFKEEQE